MTDVHELIIIGGGPAGYTAALYAARGEPRAASCSRGSPAAGQLMITSDVDNYPGFRDGIIGPELMERDARPGRALRHRRSMTDDVTRVEFSGPRRAARRRGRRRASTARAP